MCPKNYYKLLLAFFFLFTSFSLYSQFGSIKGTVLLSDNQTAAANLSVYLEDANLGTLTDMDGSFTFSKVPFGKHKIRITGIGFSSIEQDLELLDSTPLELRLRISEMAIGLPEVMVQSVSLTGGLSGLHEIPGAAHYIAPKTLNKFSATDINRVLSAVPGLNLQEEDGFGLRPNIGLRGSGSERSSKITLMEDGVLSAPAPYSAPAAYYFPSIGRMHGVEILKGSSQIRFGPFTTGGAINFISTPIPEELSGKIHLLAGSYGARNLRVNAGASHPYFGYMVESFQYQSTGFKNLPDGQNTGFDKKDYLAKFRLNTGPSTEIYQSLTFKLGQSNEASNETYLGLTATDFELDPLQRYAGSQKDLMTTEHRQYSLRHVVQFSNAVDLVTTLYRNDFYRNWYKLDKVRQTDGLSIPISDLLEQAEKHPEAFGVVNGINSVNDNALSLKANNRSYLSKGIQTVLGLRFASTSIKHSLNVGLRYHYDEIDRFQWTDDYRMDDGRMLLTKAGVPGTESNRIQSAKAFATYLQYKLQTGNWTFIPGLRYENIFLERLDYGKEDTERLGVNLSRRENQANILIPGLGISYKIKASFNLFVGLHQGFSPPGTNEGSRPEISLNYELGGRYRQGGWSGQAVLFYNDYQNLLGADLAAAGGNGTAELFNGGEAVAQGLEFELSYDLLHGGKTNLQLPLSLVYTYTDATFQSSFQSDFEGWGSVQSGDELPYLAKHQLSLSISLNNLKYDLNLNARYQSPMRTQVGQGAIPEDQQTDAYFLLNLSANYHLRKNLALFGRIANLMNNLYITARRPAGLRPGLPRTFMLGVKMDF